MNIFTKILITFIKGYRFLISPLLGHSCRYLPTCSEYTIEALRTFGFFKGILISLRRIFHVILLNFLVVEMDLTQLIKK